METLTVTGPDPVPPGTYPAKFSGLERKTSREGVPFWVWNFRLESKDRRIDVSGASSEKTGPKSKAYGWLTALLGRRPERGETLGTDLVGKPCLLVLSQDEDGYNNVENVLPRLSEKTIEAYADDADAEPPVETNAETSDDVPAKTKLPF